MGEGTHDVREVGAAGSRGRREGGKMGAENPKNAHLQFGCWGWTRRLGRRPRWEGGLQREVERILSAHFPHMRQKGTQGRLPLQIPKLFGVVALG